MKRARREDLRARAETRQQRARECEKIVKERQAGLIEGARNSLVVREVIAEDRLLRGVDSAGAKSLIRGLLDGPKAGRKLVSLESRDALRLLGTVPHLRPLNEWKPRGKGRASIFRSLCEHLLARYPTPPFLWSVFDDEPNATTLVPLIAAIAAGGSLFQLCKAGGLPFELTRVQCADFLKSNTSFGVLAALRRVQVKAAGGDQRLFEVWRSLPRNRELASPTLEAFGVTVLGLLARNPLLDRERIGPLCDYVCHRQRFVPGFSLKGRSIEALLRDMDGWHRRLNASKAEAHRAPVAFEPSGFKGYKVEKADTGGPVGKNGFSAEPRIWTVQEILSSTELRHEGQTLHHCVYSYADPVIARQTSIWSLLLTGPAGTSEKLVTLEVSNGTRSIVQARGKHNRLTTAQEDKVVLGWATRNGLTVQYGKRW